MNVTPVGRIAEMNALQAPQVAAIHARVLPESIYSELGRPFLEYYYERLLRNPDFVCLVHVLDDGTVTGFLASSAAAGKVFFRQMASDSLQLGLTLARVAAGDPSKLATLGRAARFLLRDRPRFPVTADGEVLSLAVLPEYRATEPVPGGVRPTPFFDRYHVSVGAELFRATVEALGARGARDLKIMTATDNPASNRFYTKVGCRLVTSNYLIFGHPSNLYYARIEDLSAVRGKAAAGA
jgi:ribosomal protein S18 acetylase RimI-like enzyme